MIDSAVLFLAFRRPDLTRRVWNAIRAAAPRRVYVACDGPRPDRPDDVAAVAAVRELIDEDDHGLDIVRLYRTENLGCGQAVSTAISWFFENEAEGIILEDDCLPDQTFFGYCTELLKRYRDDSNVMQIAGFNPVSDRYTPDTDYVFTQYGWQWGWATWRRAWKHYDLRMRGWPDFKRAGLHHGANFWPARVGILESTYRGEVDTWDYQWAFAMASRWGLSVVPRVNLIQNIGLGGGAHYQQTATGPQATAAAESLAAPLRHCKFIVPDPRHDAEMVARFTPRPSLRAVAGRLFRACRAVR